MATFLIKYGIQIPDNIDELRDDVVIRLGPIKEPIKDFLVSIKQLENLQGNDFINAYEALAPEVQEIWDIRVSRDHLKELAKFISNKFSSETIIEYQEYAALREYSSLPKHKKDALELFLPDTNFTFDDLVIVDNYIEDHSLEFDDIKIAGADSNT
ncbi:MAG TPA: hypothetical protein LFW21_04885 [Rickettsia endosymbiont of Pyrocoelia pectoralis]|nr:hypothetical protein [Rickettsia endosymbiont of Pyrocoelia pectoralis]